jgi:hypothetical protein
MLRSARGSEHAAQAAVARRLASLALVGVLASTALSAEQFAVFPHGPASRPFLSSPRGTVTPRRQDQWSQEESRMRSLRSSALVVGSSLALASGALAQQAVQWRVEDGGNGHWYAVTNESLVYPQLRSTCQAHGGHLATLTTQAEWEWVKTHLPIAGLFVGGYQDHTSPAYAEPNGGWRWVTDEPFVLDTAYMGTYDIFCTMTVPGFDDCPAGTCGYCGCGEPGAQDALFFTGCCNNVLDDVGDGVTQNCDSSARQGIIEWSADCNRDGIVDYGQIQSRRLADVDSNNIPDCCEQALTCPPEPAQWPIAQGGNGHWYTTIGTKLSWQDAKLFCETRGGHLVTLTSASEWSWVTQRFPECWVGANQSASNPDYSEPYGGWRWVTGEPWSFDGSYMMPFDDCPGLVMPGCACGNGAQDALFIMGCCNRMLNDNQDGSTGDCLFNEQMPLLRVDAVIEWSADCNGDGIVDFGQIRDGVLEDFDHNNIPDCCESALGCDPCRADIDESGAVNGVDLAAILNNWGTSGGKQPRSDVNSDGIVDGADLAEVLNSWGACP